MRSISARVLCIALPSVYRNRACIAALSRDVKPRYMYLKITGYPIQDDVCTDI